MPTTSCATSAGRASVRWPASAAPTATRTGRGAANPDQLKRYIENGSFFSAHIPLEAQFFKHANQRLPGLSRCAWASSTSRSRSPSSSTRRSLQKFRLSAEGLREPAAPEDAPAAHPGELRPAAVLVPAARGGGGRRQRVPASRDHPAARGDVPFLGLDERLAEADPHQQRALRAGCRSATVLGLADGDWVWVISHHGRIKVEVARIEAVNARHHLDLERHRQAGRRLGAATATCPRREKASC